MNSVLFTIAVAVFLLGAVFSNRGLFIKIRENNLKNASNSTSVLSKQTVNGDIAATPGEGENGESASAPDTVSSAMLTPFPKLMTLTPPRPTPTIMQTNLLTNFVYPGAQIDDETSVNLSMESSDSPKVISDWYKQKLNELNFIVTTSAYAQANDKYQVKDVANNGSSKLEIEISKKSGANTKISISIS